jgi:hypothetical protein
LDADHMALRLFPTAALRFAGALARTAIAAGLVMTACAIPHTSAQAQGLLEQIFGFGQPKPVYQAPPVRILRPIPAPEPRAQSRPQATKTERDTDGDTGTGGNSSSGGTYRTVCVRMCDGFYVPMSFATTRKNFQQDQAKCTATCGGEARLFVHANPGGAMEEAVDLSGRAYGRLPNAFRFRKALVEGCTCRPPPWSEAEMARHKSYAENTPQKALDANRTARQVADASPVPMPPSSTQQGAQTTQPDPAKPAASTARTALAATPPDAAVTSDLLPKQKSSSKSRTAAQGASPEDPFAPQATFLPAQPGERPRRKPEQDRIARAKPLPPPQPYAPQQYSKVVPKPQPYSQQPSSGVFVFGAPPSMGLGVKPKYTWPGD